MKRLKFLFAVLAAVPAFALETLRFDEATCGAVPDDKQDDSPALQKALDRLVAAGGGTLQVPSGTFEMHARVSVQGNISFLRIEGAGHSLSRLVCLNDDGLIKIVSTDADCVIEIVDIDLPPGRQNCGTCLELTKPYSEPQGRDYNLLLSNLELKPEAMDTCHYTDVFVTEGWMPLIDNINTSGFYGPKFNTFEGKRRKYEARSILLLKKSYKPRVRWCNFWAAEYGIGIELTDAHAEPTLEGTVSVENAHGIHIKKLGSRPFSNPVWIDGCHWNNAFSGLVMTGIDSFRLVQNCLYGAWDVEDDYADIKLVDCSRGEIVDQSFWFGVKPRPNIYIDKDCRDISIRNTHFGRGVSFEPVVIEQGAQNIDVRNNVYGTVYALDEGDTFGLWEFEEMDGNRALDKDRLHPGRNNDLVLTGAVAGPGAKVLKLGQALYLNDLLASASPVQKWDGAPGVRINIHLKIPREVSTGESTILEVPGVYRLFLRQGSLCFSFSGKPEHTVLEVPGVARHRSWIPVIAEVDPALNRAVLEVSGFGGDRRFLDRLQLAGEKKELIIAPADAHRKFTGAIDQLWIQRLGK